MKILLENTNKSLYYKTMFVKSNLRETLLRNNLNIGLQCYKMSLASE
jgi:hypothetical protein